MGRKGAFGEARSVAVTVLVDNRADLIVESSDTVKYFTDESLLAEHGFAAMIDLQPGGTRILWDAGMTPIALLENMRRMKIDPATFDLIAISHGHDDHTAGVTDVLKAIDLQPKARKWEPNASDEEIMAYLKERRVPLVMHPAALRERWRVKEDGTKYGPVYPPPRTEWEAAGAEIILSEGPYRLGPGCWTTGMVPRRSFEGAGRSSTRAYRQGSEFLHDDLEEDQAIVVNVAGKGLVIVSGCAHSGIVNTVDHAREISGVDTIWAILGGLHLAQAEDHEIQRTIDAVEAYHPKTVVPTHCTGFKAMCQFAARMPDEFLHGVVGATYLF